MARELSPGEKALTAIADELKKQERAEIRLGLIGLLGVSLLFGTGYLLWRRR
jgi:hypothetical protein